jgi:RNA polymerase sigma factor (sigma-70 family)
MDYVEKEKIFHQYKRLVYSLAHRTIRVYGLPKGSFDDLSQEGFLGLWKAIGNLDPNKNGFTTYAFKWIWGSMHKHLIRFRFIRVPDDVVTKIKEYRHIKESLKKVLEREPYIEDIVEVTGYTRKEIEDLEENSMKTEFTSLNQRINKDQDDEYVELIDLFYDWSAIPSEIGIQRNEIRVRLFDALKSLSDLEANLIKMFFGLEDGIEHSVRELARRFNISRYKIEIIALNAMWELADMMMLQGFNSEN